MSTFEVLIREVDDVIDHPNADKLNIVKVLGFEAITNKIENPDGTLSARYRKGDAIVYVPEATVVPENLLKQYGYFDEEKGKGMLAGSKGDRVKAISLRKILSQGLIWPTVSGTTMLPDHPDTATHTVFVRKGEGEDATLLAVKVGDNVAEFFSLTKYEPPVPMGMGGEVAAVYDFALDFDIENEQNFPGFLDNDEVEATEKLHGSFCRIAFRPNLNHDEMFGETGCVGIASKGLGAKGMMFKNNETNMNNLYVRTLVALDLVSKIDALGRELGQKIDLFGEIFGPGVQDLHYGMTAPVFRAFDFALDGKILSTDDKIAMFARLGVERVPVLYHGPWDRDALVSVRDGKTTLIKQDGKNKLHVREGIVVTSINDQTKREYMGHRLRPFLKMINPAYLVRGGEATEFN